ncbi:hypothetical protein AZE42_14110 [Rhizopogon vesiculosus]|uniref:Uncharacterized protein n=1 Tax=Rhizopogon vesiculosus TaxID=180088 RepID=A0A1J8QDJ5_9AGAM|nr:hypothetical protein AZE42_14110 [Rhizopogon vesiculosus]
MVVVGEGSALSIGESMDKRSRSYKHK